MMLQLANFRCAKCNSQFSAPILRSGAYAEFLLRNPKNNSLAHLDALEDKTYDEVDALLKISLYSKGKSANQLAEVLRNIYGSIACDPDENGDYYQIGALPSCPSCHHQGISHWEAIEPPVFIDEAIPSVTHKAWTSLSSQEKSTKINNFSKNYDPDHKS